MTSGNVKVPYSAEVAHDPVLDCSCQTYGIILTDSEVTSVLIAVPRPSVAHNALRDAADGALAHREWEAAAPCLGEPY